MSDKSVNSIEYPEYFSKFTDTSNTNGEQNEESKHLFTGEMDDIDIWTKFHQLLIDKENQESERGLREENATKAFNFSAIWASFVGILILLHAMCPKFELTELEFLSVIGALTSSILIYYLHVIKYLFYRKPETSKSR